MGKVRVLSKELAGVVQAKGEQFAAIEKVKSILTPKQMERFIQLQGKPLKRSS